MTAGLIPSENPQNTVRANMAGTDLSLSEGETVQARITKDLGDGKYEIQVRGSRVAVESEIPLRPGQEVSLRVLEGGERPVFEIVSARGQSPAARGADGATVPAPFLVGVELSDVAGRFESVPVDGHVPVGITSSGDATALHFPGGQIVKATAYSPAGEAHAVTAVPPEGASPLPLETQYAEAVSLARSSADVGPIPDAVLLLDKALVRAVTPGTGGQSAVVNIALPVADVESLIQSLGNADKPQPVEAPVISVDTARGQAVLQVAAARVSVAVPSGMELQAGDVLSLKIDTHVLLSGALQLTGEQADARPAPLNQTLHAIGLSPSPENRQAAEALLSYGLPVTREMVQGLQTLVAGYDGEARQLLLNAGAHLLAHDIPLSPPLAAGVASILDGQQSVSALLAQTLDSLHSVQTASADHASVLPTVDTAVGILRAMSVLLDGAEVETDLQSFFSTMGRESLGQATRLVEGAALQVLQSHPRLHILDAALQALGASELSPIAGSLQKEGAGASLPPGSVGPAVGTESGSGSGEASSMPQQGTPAAPSRTGESGGVPGGTQNAMEAVGERPSAALLTPEQAALMADRLLRGGFERLAMPGVRESMGYLPPLMKGLDEASREVLHRVVDAILNAPDAAGAREIVRETLEQQDRGFLRALVNELELREKTIMREDAVLSRLGEASEQLNDLGRRFMAYKAESLAGMRQDPAVLVGEVPFKLGRDEGSGRMQVYYRRSRRGEDGKRWSARVVLDLETSKLGSVIGDLRFVKKDLSLKVFSPDADVVDFLRRDAGELKAGLAAKGFVCEPEFSLPPDAEGGRGRGLAIGASAPARPAGPGLDIRA